MLLQTLEKRGLIHPPSWLSDNTVYLTLMGSHAYGCNEEGKSDFDYYGICIPTKAIVFPHTDGAIWGFGRNQKRFEQWQEQHIIDPSNQREYDFQVFNIIKMFMLMMENNPNCINAIYTPEDCVHHTTAIGEMIREKRDIFLHKGCWARFKGYSISQMHKMSSKQATGKRKEIRDKWGFDLKFGMHCVRLLSECEMILMEGTLDLRRNREQLKAIRRGEMSEAKIIEWAELKTKQLEELYVKSKLRETPDEPKIKQLLLDCLEHHYGSLDKCVVNPGAAVVALKQIQEVLDRNQNLLNG